MKNGFTKYKSQEIQIEALAQDINYVRKSFKFSGSVFLSTKQMRKKIVHILPYRVWDMIQSDNPLSLLD